MDDGEEEYKKTIKGLHGFKLGFAIVAIAWLAALNIWLYLG